MPNKGTIPRTCEQCGSAFLAVAYEVSIGKGRFCSRGCYLDSRGRGRWNDPTVWDRLIADGDCRLWPGRTGTKGYGVLPDPADYRNGDILAHRHAWERATGSPIPGGLIVGHVCDRPPCVRHDGGGTYEVEGILYERHGHLWLGTIAANQADMAAKLRSQIGQGGGYVGDPDPTVRRPHARLTLEQVGLIRRLYATGVLTQRTLARMFNVSQATISLIVTGGGWVA